MQAKRRTVWLALAAFMLACSLIIIPGARPLEAQTPTPTLAPERVRDWSAVNDYVIQLQRARPDRLGRTAFDLVITDIAIAGNSRQVIEGLQHSPGGEKLVVCYMSIGQAADFQYYWRLDWFENPPEWLGEPDPVWAGDRWVQYWAPEWQEIIYAGEDSYLDRIIDLGFDGVLLDRVDAATYYEDQGRETAYREMADFVIAIAEHARERVPDFGVFTINGEDIALRFPNYMDVVTGILVEDLYYGYPRDHAPSPPEWTAEREEMLDQWVEAGKLVLTLDYTLIPEQIDDAYERSSARGYIPYVTDRSLARLLIHPGHEPD